MLWPSCLTLFACFAIGDAALCDSTAPNHTCEREQQLSEQQGLLQTRVSKAKIKKDNAIGKKSEAGDNSSRPRKRWSKYGEASWDVDTLLEKDAESSRGGGREDLRQGKEAKDWTNRRQHSFYGDVKMHEVRTYDYIVVGAGTGGMAAARTLADRGAHVLVLEAGTDETFRLERYSWQEPGTPNAKSEPTSYYMPTKIYADTLETKTIGDGPGNDAYGIPLSVGGAAGHYHGVNFWYDVDIQHGLELDEAESTDLFSEHEYYALSQLECGFAEKNRCTRSTHNMSTLRPRFILNRPVPYNVCLHGKCKKQSVPYSGIDTGSHKSVADEKQAEHQANTCDLNLLTLSEKRYTKFNAQMKDWFRSNTFYEYKYHGKSSNKVDLFTEKEVIGLAVNGSFACAREWTDHVAYLKHPKSRWHGCQEYARALKSGVPLTLDGVRIWDHRLHNFYDIRARKAVILASGVMGDASILWPIIGEYTWTDQHLIGEYSHRDFQCDDHTAFGSTVHMVRCFNKTTQRSYDCQLSQGQSDQHRMPTDDELQCSVDDHLPKYIDYKTETRGTYMYYTGCKVSGKDRFIYYALFNSDPRVNGVMKHDVVQDLSGRAVVTFKAVINEGEPHIVESFRDEARLMFSKLEQKYTLPEDFEWHFDHLREHGPSFQAVHWSGGFGDEIQRSKVKGFSNFFVGDALANRGVTHSWTSFTARSAGVVAAQRAFKQFGNSEKQVLSPSFSQVIDPSIKHACSMTVTGSRKRMPLIGFGTCSNVQGGTGGKCSKPGQQLIKSTLIYFNNGGRLIDTAQYYGNHRDLAKAIKPSGVPREELWVTSKLNTNPAWIAHPVQNEQDALRNVKSSLDELGLEYLDLMLIHGPFSNTLEVQTSIWRGLIKAKAQGLVANIGVSNFNIEQLVNLYTTTGVLPALNEIEYHPWVPKETHQLVKWCQDKGIAVTAYGSLGGARNKGKSEGADLVAKKYALSTAQVLLSWALDKGVAVIPGATSEKHIKQNLATPRGLLSEADMQLIETSATPDSWRIWNS